MFRIPKRLSTKAFCILKVGRTFHKKSGSPSFTSDANDPSYETIHFFTSINFSKRFLTVELKAIGIFEIVKLT